MPEDDLASRTRYDPSEVEPRILARWLESGIFHPDPTREASGEDGQEHFSIAIPPPNVTGVLHMGHALNNSLQDCLIRHARMRGRRTKWILGTDHAGIATQTQVERALLDEGSSREALGREAFVERVWRWRESFGGRIVEQLKRLGASCDYEEERFTLDERYAKAVLAVFVALYRKGYIYRDRYLVNWDPGSRSAISDLEVEEREVTDTLFHIDYPLSSGSGSITVATVRPETMLADVAIAVNPRDERYSRLIGETAILPLVGRRLPIIADDYVKPEFGTGALKITPGHDPNDFEIGIRHGLDQLTVIGEDGRLTETAGEAFAGLRVAEAQAEVVARLREQGLLARSEAYTHTVPFSHRSGERIEPLISLQWFMRMDELAKPAIDAVRRGQVRFHPERWTRVYLEWMENIRPWCISRQLWWGHQIPVWYRDEEIHVGTEPPVGHGWERDPDVLDTWFSSALWPFATLGWPEESSPALRAFYPTSVLSTARDIIFLWVARMIMMGLEFTGEIPFADVCVHSIIQAPDGRRMSKSLGTGIDPLDLIDGGPRPPVFAKSAGADSVGDSPGGESPAGEFPAYGADAVRWGLMAMSSGQDVRFSEEKISQGQRLTNKLWNASRLVLTNVGQDARPADTPGPLRVEDRWIVSRLERARAEIDGRIDAFDFAHAALALYDFVYEDLCDWYLELVKPRLHAGEPELAPVLLHVLRETLRIAHPLIPFVTEEIHDHLPGADGLLAASTENVRGELDEAAEAEIGRLIDAVRSLRAWRESTGVRPGVPLVARLQAAGYEDTTELLASLARLDLDGSVNGSGDGPAAAVAIAGGSVALFAGAGFDPEAAQSRRAEQRAKLEVEIGRAAAKLANQGFVAKAPAAVVQGERQKLQQLQQELEAL